MSSFSSSLGSLETHSEQSGKLKSSSERHLQLSGGRQVQSAPDRLAHTVTVVLNTGTTNTHLVQSWTFVRD